MNGAIVDLQTMIWFTFDLRVYLKHKLKRETRIFRCIFSNTVAARKTYLRVLLIYVYPLYSQS